MNRSSVLVLSAILTLSLPYAVAAQDAGAPPGGDAAAEAGAGNAGDEGAGAGAGGDAGDGAFTYDDLNAALQNMADADLSAVTADTRIDIVTMSSLDETAAEEADEYTTSIPSDQSDIADLRAAMETNTHITAALEAEGYTIEDVAAAWVQGDGSLTIFVDDSQASTGEAEGGAETEAPAEDAAAPQ